MILRMHIRLSGKRFNRTGVFLIALSGFLLPLVSASETLGSSVAPSRNAWEKPRDLSSFQQLLKRSPFSLPTAEESSPLADRYAMTGIVNINGEEQIFVFDRTDQSRELIGRKPNTKNMSLVSLIRDGNTVPQKASILVGSETGTIGFLESTQQKGAPPAQAIPGSVSAGIPGLQGTQPGVHLPQLPPLPQLPGASQSQQIPQGSQPGQGRRIIRRPVITAPQPQNANP
ncbi:MAG: hypothetical protein WCR44_03110 [Verrucomicrobiota bacterium]